MFKTEEFDILSFALELLLNKEKYRKDSDIDQLLELKRRIDLMSNNPQFVL